MMVLVTGGTGFLGSHCTAELVRAGHQVRVLARTPAKLEQALAPFGSPAVEVAQGDITDRGSVERALEGCTAVLHCANVYASDVRRGQEMLETNRVGTEHVLGRAVERGCDPIVHVSSVVALYPAREPLPPDPPIGTGWGSPYVQSKLMAERIARVFQAQGAPVVTTYPGAIWGPHDPSGPNGEMAHMLTGFLGNRYPFRMTRGGAPICDVQWLAKVHAALFEPDQGPRRVTTGGHYLSWYDLYDKLRALTGRRLPLIFPSPRFVVIGFGQLASMLQHVLPFRLPLGVDAGHLIFDSAPTDDRIASGLAGPIPSFEQTAARAISWAASTGAIPARYAGKLRTDLAPRAVHG